jgi:hypothetical protein
MLDVVLSAIIGAYLPRLVPKSGNVEQDAYHSSA